MRETVEAVRRLLAMERVTYHGEFVHLDDVEIDIVHGDRSPKHVPIYIGATAMKMMELAGEIGDGVRPQLPRRPRLQPRGDGALAIGAERAGRTIDDVDRPQLVVCSLDDDRSLALDRARELVTQYLGQQPHIMKASGVAPELLEEIGAVLTWPATAEQIEKAMHLVPDEVVQLITASGTADECRAKVREYVASGCTCPVLYPLGDDVPAMIDAFAEGNSDIGKRTILKGLETWKPRTLTDRDAIKTALVGKDYIETIDWTVEEIEEALAVSMELKADRKAGRPHRLLAGQDAVHALPRQVDAHPQRLRDGHDPARRPRDLPRRRQDAGRARREPEGHGDHPLPLRRGHRDPPRPRARTRATRGCARSRSGPTSR